MADQDELDNRYEIMAKHVNSDIIIEKRIHKEIDRANDFLIYDAIFKKIIEEMKLQHPDSEIIINITSGTTQITASLYLLAASLPFPVTLVQVSTPAKAANKTQSLSREYNINDEIRNLIDDLQDDEIENRCREVVPQNVIKLQYKEAIQSYVKAYDYQAAVQLMNIVPELFSSELKSMMLMAKYRLELDHKNAQKIVDQLQIDCYPLSSNEVKLNYEYILYLQRLQKKQHINDFSRALSPIILNLFIYILKEKARIDIREKYCEKSSYGGFKLIRNRLSQDPEIITYYDHSDLWGGSFADTHLAPINILPLIKRSVDKGEIDRVFYEKCLKLREIEQNIRNNVAHQIYNVDDTIYREKVNVTSEQTLTIIKDLFEYIYSSKYKRQIDWDSYDTMNVEIMKYIAAL
jgi:CRISPR type III-A/MTUBE-associated protein Csm6